MMHGQKQRRVIWRNTKTNEVSDKPPEGYGIKLNNRHIGEYKMPVNSLENKTNKRIRGEYSRVIYISKRIDKTG